MLPPPRSMRGMRCREHWSGSHHLENTLKWLKKLAESSAALGWCSSLGDGHSGGGGSPNIRTTRLAATFRMCRFRVRLHTGNIRTRLSRTDHRLVFSRTAWNMLCRSVLWVAGLRDGMCGEKLPSCLNIVTT